MGKAARSAAAYLRVIREDITDINSRLSVTELTALETIAISSILDALQEDLTLLRARLETRR